MTHSSTLTQLSGAADALTDPVVVEPGHTAAASTCLAPRSLHPAEARSRRRGERGMVTAEWAVGIIAAIAVAGVLLAVVTSGPVHDMLLKFILSVINQFSAGFAKL